MTETWLSVRCAGGSKWKKGTVKTHLNGKFQSCFLNSCTSFKNKETFILCLIGVADWRKAASVAEVYGSKPLYLTASPVPGERLSSTLLDSVVEACEINWQRTD